MSDISGSLVAVDALSADVLTDDVSDNYVSKTLFAVSEFANVVRAGAKTISGEVLLCGISATACGSYRNAAAYATLYCSIRGRKLTFSYATASGNVFSRQGRAVAQGK
jgi:hypothetical protein